MALEERPLAPAGQQRMPGDQTVILEDLDLISHAVHLDKAPPRGIGERVVVTADADHAFAADPAVELEHRAKRDQRQEEERRLFLGKGLVDDTTGGGVHARVVAQRLDRPGRLTPGKTKRRLKRIGLGKPFERRDLRVGSPPDIVDIGKAPTGTRGEDGGGIGVGEAPHHPETKADGKALVIDGLERAVPARGINADRADFDAMLLGVTNDLCRRVDPRHRILRIYRARGAEG